MSYQTIYRLYTIKRPIELVINNRVLRMTRTDNTIMNNQKIKLHKGVDNKIDFRVTDPDRKPQRVDGYVVDAYLIDKATQRQVFRKPLTLSSEKGMMILEVNESELLDITPGFYDLAVVAKEEFIPKTTGEMVGTPFFTNLETDITIPVEVKTSLEQSPTPSYVAEEDDWLILTPGRQQLPPLRSYTSAFPANRSKIHDNSFHSFSVRLKNYTGKLEVLGSMDNQPDQHPELKYFPLKFTQGESDNVVDYVEFEDFTGITWFNFDYNLQWVKFQRTDDNDNIGEIKKLIFRS